MKSIPYLKAVQNSININMQFTMEHNEWKLTLLNTLGK